MISLFCHIHTGPWEALGVKNHSGSAFFTNTMHLNPMISLAFKKRPFLPRVCITTKFLKEIQTKWQISHIEGCFLEASKVVTHVTLVALNTSQHIKLLGHLWFPVCGWEGRGAASLDLSKCVGARVWPLSMCIHPTDALLRVQRSWLLSEKA